LAIFPPVFANPPANPVARRAFVSSAKTRNPEALSLPDAKFRIFARIILWSTLVPGVGAFLAFVLFGERHALPQAKFV
jgi:hypothetical protein